jgi:hypothetical protein
LAIAAVVTAAAASLAGLFLVNQPEPSRSNEAGDKSQSLIQWVACATVIAEGDVVAVRPAPQRGRLVLTFAVRDWIKPAQGARRVELNVVDPRVANVRRAWKPQKHVMIGVPVRRDLEAVPFTGRRLAFERPRIERALQEVKAGGVTCPPYWRNTPRS